MVNMREIIADGLLKICDNVKMSKPDGDIELPLICYAEMSNTNISIDADRLRYRVAIYTGTFDELVDLTEKVDQFMHTELGFTRTGRTSDGEARIGTDLYLCRIDYSVLVNTILNYVVHNST